jgi:hypothetical protein
VENCGTSGGFLEENRQSQGELVVTLAELIDHFTRVRLATAQDNAAILQFINSISMQTEEGGLGIDRLPDFFSLTRMQGDKSFTFLFDNDDGSIGGIGCISVTTMQIKGRAQRLGYCSDLKFSRKISRDTRKEFYQFYQSLIEKFSTIEELEGCEYVVTSILDGNVAAKKSLVHQSSKKNQLQHRPVYQYENINVLARLPRPTIGGLSVLTGAEVDHQKILEFLTSNPENSEMVWTKKEIERRQHLVGFSFDDFLLQTDKQGEIRACTLLLSDYQHRKMRVSRMPMALKISQLFTPLLGQPKIRENEALKVGYLSFLKIAAHKAKTRAAIIDAFLQKVFRQQKSQAPGERFHLYNIQEPKNRALSNHLVRRGYLSQPFSSTLYQVTAKTDPQYFLTPQQQRMDFDVVFH